MVSCPSTYMVHTPRYVPKTLQNVRSNTVLHGGISVRSGLTPSYIGQIRSNPGVKRSDAVRPRGYNGQFRPYGGNDTHMKDTTTLFYFDRSRNHFSRLTESSLSTCPGLLLSQLTWELSTRGKKLWYVIPSETCSINISYRVEGPTWRGNIILEGINGNMSYAG